MKQPPQFSLLSTCQFFERKNILEQECPDGSYFIRSTNFVAYKIRVNIERNQSPNWPFVCTPLNVSGPLKVIDHQNLFFTYVHHRCLSLYADGPPLALYQVYPATTCVFRAVTATAIPFCISCSEFFGGINHGLRHPTNSRRKPNLAFFFLSLCVRAFAYLMRPRRPLIFIMQNAWEKKKKMRFYSFD